jgi:hypothetical protein
MFEKSTEKMHFTATQSPKKGVSKMTGDLLAVGIFAIGVGAFVGVGYLGYVKFLKDRPPSSSSAQTQETTAAKQPAEQASNSETCPGCAMPQPKPAEALPSERKLTVPDEKEMAGSWEYDFGSGVATLRLADGAFQLIFAQGAERRARQFARGLYSYDAENGILHLVPSRDLGEPDPVEGVHYGILTVRPYKVLVREEKSSGDIFWTPHIIGTLQDQVHPLFGYTNTQEGAIRWRTEG